MLTHAVEAAKVRFEVGKQNAVFTQTFFAVCVTPDLKKTNIDLACLLVERLTPCVHNYGPVHTGQRSFTTK